MELRSLMFILVIFSVGVIAINGVLKDWVSDYTTPPEDMSNLEFINQTEDEMNKIHEAMQSSQITGTPLDIGIFFVTGIYNIFKFFVADMLNIYSGITTNISTYLFLPKWAVSAVLLSLLIFVLFEIISAIIKWRV